MGGFQPTPPPQYEMQPALCTHQHGDHNSWSRKSTDSNTNPNIDYKSHWELLPFYSSPAEDLDANWETDSYSSYSSYSDTYSYSSNCDNESDTEVCCNCHKRKEKDLEAQEKTSGGEEGVDNCCSCYDAALTAFFMVLAFLMACGFVWAFKQFNPDVRGSRESTQRPGPETNGSDE